MLSTFESGLTGKRSAQKKDKTKGMTGAGNA
jgi:hypothetical protein